MSGFEQTYILFYPDTGGAVEGGHPHSPIPQTYEEARQLIVDALPRFNDEEILKMAQYDQGYWKSDVAQAALIGTPLGLQLLQQYHTPPTRPTTQTWGEVGRMLETIDRKLAMTQDLYREVGLFELRYSPQMLFSPAGVKAFLQMNSEKGKPDFDLGLFGYKFPKHVGEYVEAASPLMAGMGRFKNYLPDVRISLGIDSGWRDRFSTTGKTIYGSTSPNTRVYLHALLGNGIFTREQYIHEYPQLAQQLIGTVIDWDPGQSTHINHGILPALMVWSQEFAEKALNAQNRSGGPQRYRTVGKVYEPQPHLPNGRIDFRMRPSEDKALRVDTRIQQLTKVTQEWMAQAGWVDPHRHFELPLMLMQAAYDAGARKIQGSSFEGWGHVENWTRSMIDEFISFTIPGAMMRACEHAILHAAADKRFYELFEQAGYPITVPETTPTDKFEFTNAYPEHLVWEAWERQEDRIKELKDAYGRLYREGKHDGKDHVLDLVSELNERVGNKRFIQEMEILGIFQRYQIDPGQHSTDLQEAISTAIRTEMNGLTTTDGKNLFQFYKPDHIADHLEFASILHQMLELLQQNNENARRYVTTKHIAKFPDNIKAMAQDTLNVIPFTFSLEKGVPFTFLGSNGQGKSTLLAAMIQHFYAPGYVMSEMMKTPKGAWKVLPAADAFEVVGEAAQRKARRSGKSAFLSELDELIERFQFLEKYAGILPVITFGDEVGRRTDQLNAMALVSTELLLNAYYGHYTIQTYHYNRINQLLHPLMKKLGFDMKWGTLEGHKIREIGSEEQVESHALETSSPYLDPKIGKIWQDLEGKREYEFGNKQDELPDIDLHSETLNQLAWIKVEHGRKHFDGAIAKVLGYGSDWEFGSNRERMKYEEEYSIKQLSKTLLNQMWEHTKHISSWVNRSRDNQDRLQALAEGPIGLRNFVILINRYRDFLKDSYGQKEEQYNRDLEDLAKQLPNFRQEVTILKDIYPDFPFEAIDRILDFMEDLPSRPILEFNRIFNSAESVIYTLEALRVLPNNIDQLDLHHVTKDPEGPLFSLKQFWSESLNNILRGGEVRELVKNDLDIRKSVYITGPQASGKTETGRAIAEALTLTSTFGLATAESVSYASDFAVLPLFSIPEATTVRTMSSQEREAALRMNQVVKFCEGLPDGTIPVVVLDELMSSTNTSEAAVGIRAIKRYIESKGGIVIMTTHCHEALWEMDRDQESYQPITVGGFWTDEAYKLFEGHGDSMGVEVAEMRGMDPKFAQLAKMFRRYYERVSSMEIPDEETLDEFAQIIKTHLENNLPK